MIQYPPGAKAIWAKALKRYVSAVVVGVLIGGVFAAADAATESLPGAPLSKLALARPPNSVNILDGSAAEPEKPVLAPSISGLRHDGGGSPQQFSETVRLWAT